jgi:hypothetical protein
MLTPFIESGNIVEGKYLSRVTEPLFGLGRDEMVESYSGFLTVNKSMEKHMFFWFFPSTVSNIFTVGTA